MKNATIGDEMKLQDTLLPAWRSLTLLTIAAWFVNAAAQTAEQLQEPADQYDIEVVIFERFGQGNEESWPDEIEAPDRSLAVGDLRLPDASGIAELLDDAKQLGPDAYTLTRKGFAVHAHERWRQPVNDRGSPDWLVIGDRQLNGLIRVTRGRYLHINYDLLLRDDTAGRDYRIQGSRRMRSDELHYIDHPKIGLLVVAQRHEIAPLPAEETPIPRNDVPPAPQNLDPNPKEQRDIPSDRPRRLPDPT